MDNYHLTHDGAQWVLQPEKSDEVLVAAATKEEATHKMQAIMEERTGSVKIHKEDGTIQEERTYPRSADPSKSPG